MEKINNIIRFDLHIHSIASQYKESSGIVDNSTKENLHILFEKLNINKIALFSITDHNRFDAVLYKEIKRMLSEEQSKYPNVQNVLAGIEFDVKLEDDKDKCHIITIFDVKNDSEYEKIEKVINENKLTNKEDFYSKDDFRNILVKIGLNTILIASQTKSLSNSSTTHNALNDSTENVKEVLKIKYINALEFQKSKVEGILLNDLKEMDLRVPLITGSDCHDWSVYPDHDAINHKENFQYAEAKMLPTFKGLLMAVTSPISRFNCNKNNNSVISSITINNKEIQIVNGINVIIGENGSGKSTLLECIVNKIPTKSYVKKIAVDNDINVRRNKESVPKYISQGQIADEFNKRKLFQNGASDLFNEPNHSEFIDKYTKFAKNLKNYILNNIEKSSILNSLKTSTLKYNNCVHKSNFYINIKQDLKTNNKNEFEEKKEKIENLERIFKDIKSDKYFERYSNELIDIERILSIILKNIKNDYFKKELERKSQSIIISCINEYQSKISTISTSQDKLKIRAVDEFNSFVSLVSTAIETSFKKDELPNFPEEISGFKKNTDGGFSFNCEAEYHNKILKDEYLKYIFNQKYQDISKIKEINTKEIFKEAIKGCSDINNIDNDWDINTEKFINNYKKIKKYILDETGGQNIGNTMGEMSLAYYKYYTQDQNSWDLLVIDQPEDNISNNNINSRLLNYFSKIRDNKQIIFVTHNPLLVVNLDADNIIYIKNVNNKLTIENGCLEYEDENVNILDIIANIMDGGIATIERRLDVYAKKY